MLRHLTVRAANTRTTASECALAGGRRPAQSAVCQLPRRSAIQKYRPADAAIGTKTSKRKMSKGFSTGVLRNVRYPYRAHNSVRHSSRQAGGRSTQGTGSYLMVMAKRKTLVTKKSAGILAHRMNARGLDALLVHPGGPFWRNKDEGAWSIPKGEIDPSEDPEQAARREFAEEAGPGATILELTPLGEIRQRGRKRVIAFAGEGGFDPATLESNTFEIEWPPRSCRRQAFPEIDRAQWFDPKAARAKLLPAQVEFLDRLSAIIGADHPKRHRAK